MNLFPWKKHKEFFTEEEKQRIVEAIRGAELQTSGEVRVYVESKCRFVDALDRAQEIFAGLRMHETKLRNGTLVYLAVKDHQAAVFGDTGIHEKVGPQYWQQIVGRMLQRFKQQELTDGICQAVTDLGQALQTHFPYNSDTDKNELPDDIVFGR